MGTKRPWGEGAAQEVAEIMPAEGGRGLLLSDPNAGKVWEGEKADSARRWWGKREVLANRLIRDAGTAEALIAVLWASMAIMMI